MARVTIGSVQMSQPAWAADYLSRDHLIPSFARADLSQFAGEAVKSGSLVGRTQVEADAGAAFGAVAVDGEGVVTDDQVFLVAFDGDEHGGIVLVRPGTVIRPAFLPGWADLSAEVQARVRALYHCV